MRVAVVSDIHSNLHALEAVLAAIDAEAPDELWCLGDIVGYGARPNECCAAIAERADVCLAGNHDLAVRGTIDLGEFGGEAGVAARWTRDVLEPEAQELLDRLEPQGAAHGVALYHGSARDPIWEYVLSDEAAFVTIALANAPLVLVGHSHVALQIVLSGEEISGGGAPDGSELELVGAQALLNPRSVGQPRDGDPHAA
jgi:predicted phosphodiesterase